MEQKKHLGLNARLERRAMLRLMAVMPAGALYSAAGSATAAPKELATEPVSPDATTPINRRSSIPTSGQQFMRFVT